jgi:hypothetical protein
VYVVFDSDVMLKEPVRLAMERMGAALKRMGAKVAYVYLPSGEGGAKVGADDFLAAGHPLGDVFALATTELRKPLMPEGVGGGPEPRAPVHQPPRLAYEPDLLGRFIADMRRLGHVGEEAACRLVYLAATSRVLDTIVSVVLKGPSAAGKSATVDRVLQFFPDEAVVQLSGMSERFLVYDDRPIAHRMLILHEAAGMSGEYQTYLIRTLLSEGCLRHGTVESTSEGLKPMLVVRQGPAGLITTTTQVNLHPENETRLLSIPADDTRDQTKAVMAAVARNGQPVDMGEWHQLQHWLADGECRVVIPFAELLAELVPPINVALRRYFGSLLALVRAHALLHRATRATDEHGEVVATLEDYAAVRDLVIDVIGDRIGAAVSTATRETVNAVAAVIAAGAEHATNRQLAEALNIDPSAMSRRVRKAIADGYLVNDEDRQRRPTKLKLGDPLPEDLVILPQVETVDAHWCASAPGSEPRHTPTDDGGAPNDEVRVLSDGARTLAELSDDELLEAAGPGATLVSVPDSRLAPKGR